MGEVNQSYKAAWFKDLSRYDEWNRRAVYAILAHLDLPKSVIDFGSGNGQMCWTLHKSGVHPVYGVEVDSDAIKFGKWGNILISDLSQPFKLDKHPHVHLAKDESPRFDLVLSLETAEHLSEEAADTFCDTLAYHVGRWLVFTAAAPDQGGDGHINCQPQEYWRKKLVERGLAYDSSVTDQLRETWKWVTGPMFWLPQNLQVFYRG